MKNFCSLLFVFSGKRNDLSLRVLGSFFCFVAATAHIWSKMFYTKANTHFGEALGDDYLKRMPEITKFTLSFFHSSWWEAGQILPSVAGLLLWIFRPPWLLAVVSAVVASWTITFLTVTLFSLWMGDMMIVHAIELSAKAKGLIPK
jgi:hypothetical protein